MLLLCKRGARVCATTGRRSRQRHAASIAALHHVAGRRHVPCVILWLLREASSFVEPFWRRIASLLPRPHVPVTALSVTKASFRYLPTHISSRPLRLELPRPTLIAVPLLPRQCSASSYIPAVVPANPCR